MDPLEKSLSPLLDSTVLWVAHRVHAGVTFSTISKLRCKRSLHCKSIAWKVDFSDKNHTWNERLLDSAIGISQEIPISCTTASISKKKLWAHWHSQSHSELTIEQFQPGHDKVTQDIRRVLRNLCSNPDCWTCHEPTQKTKPVRLSFNNTWSQTLEGSFGGKKKKLPVMDGPVAQVGGMMNSNQRPPLGLLSMGYFLKHLLPRYPSSYEWRSRQEEWRCQS